MRSKRFKGGISLIASLLGISSLFIGSLGMAAAASSQIYVAAKNCSNSGPGTQQKPFCTVQEGVNAVASGGTVSIDKGTYTEQVVIGSGKNNVTLRGNGAGSTTIKAPTTMTSSKAIVKISGVTGIAMRDLTVSGPGGGGCDSLEYGIRVDTAGQATINDVHVANIADSPFSGCQNGVGIQVGRDHPAGSDPTTDPADITTGSATIVDSKVDGYQKNGITASNTGSSVTVVDSTVIGAGPTAVIAQNGIQVSSGATATLRDNNVKNNVYSLQTVASTGVLLFDPGTVTLTDNTVNSNDVNVYVIGVTNSQFTDNVTNKATYNGIYVDQDSSGNTFRDNSAHNTASGTGNFDMQDDSSGSGTLNTANTWRDNSCKTSSPAGLCKQ